MAKKPKLSERQKRFAELIVLEQKSIVDAYELAGYSCEGTRTTQRRNAYALYKTATVQAYIKELSELALEKSETIFLKLLLFYQDILTNDSASMKDKLQASKYLADLYNLLSTNLNIGAQEDLSINFNIKTSKQEDDAE